MRVRFDEHVAPAIVDTVEKVALGPQWEVSSVHRAGQAGASDVHWITQFAAEGGDAIVSADSDFLKLEPQVNAVFDTGIKVIHLPPRWGEARRQLQAAHILQWWSRIEKIVETMNGRECYRPDWNLSETGKLKKIPIDFQKAHKQRRKKRR